MIGKTSMPGTDASDNGCRDDRSLLARKLASVLPRVPDHRGGTSRRRPTSWPSWTGRRGGASQRTCPRPPGGLRLASRSRLPPVEGRRGRPGPGAPGRGGNLAKPVRAVGRRRLAARDHWQGCQSGQRSRPSLMAPPPRARCRSGLLDDSGPVPGTLHPPLARWVTILLRCHPASYQSEGVNSAAAVSVVGNLEDFVPKALRLELSGHRVLVAKFLVAGSRC
jgi:hypothetical protein